MGDTSVTMQLFCFAHDVSKRTASTGTAFCVWSRADAIVVELIFSFFERGLYDKRLR